MGSFPKHLVRVFELRRNNSRQGCSIVVVVEVVVVVVVVVAVAFAYQVEVASSVRSLAVVAFEASVAALASVVEACFGLGIVVVHLNFGSVFFGCFVVQVFVPYFYQFVDF